MLKFADALKALITLLNAVGEKYWVEQLQDDLAQYEMSGRTSGHLAKYGGMGSFNDFGICGRVGHRVRQQQESWAEVLFQWIRSLCFYLARCQDCQASLEQVKTAVGVLDAPLNAFVGGANASNDTRGLAVSTKQLSGWRCLR